MAAPRRSNRGRRPTRATAATRVRAAHVDEDIRALMRLLARQAARECFERDMNAGTNARSAGDQ